jgi:hypothetical protein
MSQFFQSGSWTLLEEDNVLILVCYMSQVSLYMYYWPTRGSLHLQHDCRIMYGVQCLHADSCLLMLIDDLRWQQPMLYNCLSTLEVYNDRSLERNAFYRCARCVLYYSRIRLTVNDYHLLIRIFSVCCCDAGFFILFYFVCFLLFINFVFFHDWFSRRVSLFSDII